MDTSCSWAFAVQLPIFYLVRDLAFFGMSLLYASVHVCMCTVYTCYVDALYHGGMGLVAKRW